MKKLVKLKYKNTYYVEEAGNAEKIQEIIQKHGKPDSIEDFESAIENSFSTEKDNDMKFKQNGSSNEWTVDPEEIGIIDCTNGNLKGLYEKLLEKYVPKLQLKSELEDGNTVIISNAAELKINTLLHKFPTLEFMIGLVGRFDDTNKVWIVDDVVLPEQEITSASVEATKDGNKELAKTPNLIGFSHSHNNMRASICEKSPMHSALPASGTIRPRTSDDRSSYGGRSSPVFR